MVLLLQQPKQTMTNCHNKVTFRRPVVVAAEAEVPSLCLKRRETSAKSNYCGSFSRVL